MLKPSGGTDFAVGKEAQIKLNRDQEGATCLVLPIGVKAAKVGRQVPEQGSHYPYVGDTVLAFPRRGS